MVQNLNQTTLEYWNSFKTEKEDIGINKLTDSFAMDPPANNNLCAGPFRHYISGAVFDDTLPLSCLAHLAIYAIV